MSEGILDGALTTMEEPDNLDTVEDIATSPEMQHAIEDLSASLVRGALSGVEDGPITAEERDAALEGAGAALAEGITNEIPSPEHLVNRALAAATSDANREQTRLMVAALTETLIRSATTSLADGMREDIFPAIDEASEKSSPAIATILDEDTREAVGAMVYEVSRQSTLGVEAGMDQVSVTDEVLGETLLGNLSIKGWLILAGLLLMLFGTTVGVIVLALQSRRRGMLLDNSRDRERVLAALVAGLNGHGLDGRQLARQLGLDPDDLHDDGDPGPTTSSTATRPSSTRIATNHPRPAFAAT